MCGYLVVLLLGFISVLLLYSSPQMPYLCGCDCWAFLVCHCELLNINISSEVCVCFSTKFFAFIWCYSCPHPFFGNLIFVALHTMLGDWEGP